jgi:hypothetical protein
METYIGTKLIQAEPCTKDGVEGYKVVYPQPDGSTYESWSPKDVFEDAYRCLRPYERVSIKSK